MNDFKFSFSVDNQEATDPHKDTKDEIPTSEVEKKWFDAMEMYPNERMIENIYEFVEKADMFFCGDHEIGHVFSDNALKFLEEQGQPDDLENTVLKAESQHSDLLAGKYEGGLKVWEGTTDLAEYLCDKKILWENTTVLDLGCGAGILGIIAMVSGAKVHFQDYNKEVINAVTIPNVLLNLPDSGRDVIKTKCKFFSGDWGSLSNLMEKGPEEFKYDYILTSETIYNTENHEKLYNLIKHRLKKDGSAYIAAKTYYFGVGGSVRQFESVVKSDDVMCSEVCWKSTCGVVREIIKLTYK